MQDAERATGREYSAVIQRFQPQIERDGRPPARIFSDFMQIMTVMQGNDPNAKAQLLRTVAQQNGIDARTLLGIPPNVGPQPPGQPGPGGAPAPGLVPLPPAFAEMQRQWADLRARLDAQAQTEQRAAQERAQREEQEIAQEISNFQSRAEIRFFDQVKDHMIALLNGGVASNLEEAYNSAIYARPDIRAILENEARAKADAEAKQRQRVQQARIRGGSVKGGSGSNAGAAPADRSLREELQANFAAANSRA